MRALVLVSVLAIACAPSQARQTTRHAEYAIGGSLVGIIGGALLIGALPENKTIGIATCASFGGLAVLSTIVYGVAYANIPPPRPPPPPEDYRPEAWELTKQAQAAARAGDCVTVQMLDPRIARLDAGVHDAVFVRDVAVARCLAPVTAPPSPLPRPASGSAF